MTFTYWTPNYANLALETVHSTVVLARRAAQQLEGITEKWGGPISGRVGRQEEQNFLPPWNPYSRTGTSVYCTG